MSLFSTRGSLIPTINLESDVLCIKLCFYSHAKIHYLFTCSFTFLVQFREHKAL
jgi:hypothetical protein